MTRVTTGQLSLRRNLLNIYFNDLSLDKLNVQGESMGSTTDHHTPSHTLLWLRHDLRIQDNPALVAAARHARRHQGSLLIVWFFESRWVESDSFGTARMGKRRARFLLESVMDVADELKALGHRLLVLRGDPTEVIPQLASDYELKAVFASRHVAHEETEQEQRLARRLSTDQVTLNITWTHTLFRQSQLPFSLSDLPDVFTHFRKRIERSSVISDPLPAPTQLPPCLLDMSSDHAESSSAQSSVDQLDDLRSIWMTDIEDDDRSAFTGKGGAKAATERLSYYLWESRHVERYKETRNGLVGADYSTKLSPWLATGSISPKVIWAEVLRYEQERTSNQSTYWVRFELLWREYFQWVAALYGPHLFRRAGLSVPLSRQVNLKGQVNQRRFQRWCQGATGDPFVDANMRELEATGWMSNRGRQNVASYLIHDLGVDWRMGAGYFERELLDYDPASNWGNWAYIAGVGNDPRPQRKFNTAKQAERYDQDRSFQMLWS